MRECLSFMKKWMTRLLAGIATVLLSIMTLLVLYQVRYFLIWTGFIGAAYAFITREHMCLVLVRDSLSPSRKRILMTLIDVLILVFAIFVLTIGGFKLALSAKKVYSALLGIPRSLVYAMAPVSGIFIILAQIINIYEDITGITVEGGTES